MKRLYFLIFISILAFTSQAQPLNDDCVDATTLTDVVKFCANFNANGYTYDTEGSDCGPNLSPPNMWFEFVAAGSFLDLDVATAAGTEVAMINLFAVDPLDPCNTLVNIFCTETGVINNLTGLVAGNTYYFSVSFTNAAGGSLAPAFELCITSGDPQANNDPCAAINLNLVGCESTQSNILAGPNINFQPLCPGAWTSQLWYTANLLPNNHILEVSIAPAGTDPITGDIFISVGQFESGCLGGFAFIDFYCGPANTTVEFFGLNPAEQYFVVVATNQDFEGEFELCTMQAGEDNCVVNDNTDDCGAGVPIISPIIPGGAVNSSPFICDNYCIDNASPVFDYSIFATCGFDLNNSTVWFQVNTGPLAQFMNIDLAGITMTFPGIAVFQGDCSNPTLVGCNAASGSDLVINDLAVTASSSYWVAVTSLDDNFGTFELCVNTFFPVNPCNNTFNLEEVGSSIDESPEEGPYCPGEEVQFCFQILSYDASTAGSNCQWLQAIIPSFGDGWDPSSFGPTGEPLTVTRPTTLHGGTWGWYEDNEVDYNLSNPNIHVITGAHGLRLCSPIFDPNCNGTPLANGVGLPGGWYNVNPNGGSDTGPDDTFGDGSGCSNSTDGPWEVCFTLIARMHPDCQAQPTFNDCELSVVAFPDGETGDWVAANCVGVIPTPINAFIDCSAVPQIEAENQEICTGQTFVVTLTSPQDPLIYTWTVDAPPAIVGESDGSGPVISQTLTNNSNAPVDVIYSVIGQKTSCPGLADVTVTVYPEIDIDPAFESGCALQTFALGTILGAPTGGKPPYMYSWSNGSTSNNPQVQANADAVFTVTITDDVGCSAVSTVTLDIFDIFEVQIDGPMAICLSEGSATLTATPLGGNMPFGTYDWQLPDGSSLPNAGNTIQADQTGTYLVTVKDAGNCPGTGEFEFVVNENPTSEIISFPEGAICEGSTTQLFDGSVPGSSLITSTTWITPPDYPFDPFVSGNSTDVPGDYSLITIDENGCSDTFTLTLDVQSAPEAFPATLQICHEASGIGIFDLTLAENTINNNTGFDVDFFTDAALTNQISVLNVDNYSSGPATIYAVVFNDADCPSPVVEVTLSFLPEIVVFDTSQTVCLEASGLGTFDLTLLIDIINGGSSLPVTFYHDLDGTIVITNPASHQAAQGVVYAQAEGSAGCLSRYALIDINTDTLLEAFDTSLSACKTINGTGIFDLTTQDATIAGGQALDVIWYSNNTPPLNVIANPASYESAAGSVFATVSDGRCIANVVEIDLSLTTNVMGNEITIDECNRGDNTGRFDLTASDVAVGGAGSTIYWYSDALATMAIADATDFESGEVIVYAIVEDANRCVSDPVPVTLNLEYLAIADIDSVKTCDPGNGMGTFDLTAQDDVINGGTGWTVEWYEDASATVSIGTPSNYTSGNTDVYALVRNGECVSEPIDVTLAVTNDLRGNPITIEGCDEGSGMHAFDLTASNILISPDGLDVEYFTDNAATVPVANDQNFVSGDATIYAVVRDGVCRSPITTIMLDVEITVFPPEETGEECDEGGGVGTFDLSTYVSLIAGSGGSVAWFEDAAATIPVATPNNWSTTPRDIYAVVTDANGCISAPTIFHLETDNNLPAFPAASEACDDGFGMGVFNLDLLIATITGGNSFSVEFYTDLALTNLVTGTNVYASGAGTIYAITRDGPCQSLPVAIDLSLIPPIVATTADLDLCDEGSGNAVFDLTLLNGNVNNGQTHTVIWYEDAALTVPIADPTSFTSSGASVWAILTNGNCNSEAVEVPLTVTTITGNAVADETCDEGAGTGTFDLKSLEASIVSQVGQTVTWYSDAALTQMIQADLPYTSAGATLYAVTSDGRCSSQPVEITLTLTDKLPATITSLADCDDGDGMLIFNLNAVESIINTGGGDVVWFLDALGTMPIVNEVSFESGTRTVYAQVQDGPCRSDIIGIDLTVEPLPVVDAGPTQEITCRSAFLDITGSAPTGAYTYLWTTTDGNIVSGSSDLTVRVDMPGTYTLEVTNTLTNCVQSDQVVITEDVNIPIANAGPDTDISCVEELTEIGSTATTTGSDIVISWTLDGNPIAGNTPIITASQPGVYEITVLNNASGCRNTDMVTVISTIAELTDLALDINNPNCNGANTGCIEMINVVGGQGPYSVSVDQVNFFTTTDICNLGAGNYLFTVRDINGCVISQDVVIEQPEVLTVQITGNNIINYRDSTFISAVHSPSDVVITDYEWISDNHFNTTIDSMVGVTGLTEFPVSVTITDENGCVASDEIIIYVKKDFKVFAPTAFSPKKADNINDRFFLMGDEEIVTSVDLIRIYSRWGEKLFERTGLQINDDRDGWDGTFEGEQMMPGAYVYYAEVTFVDGSRETIQGEVLLIE